MSRNSRSNETTGIFRAALNLNTNPSALSRPRHVGPRWPEYAGGTGSLAVLTHGSSVRDSLDTPVTPVGPPMPGEQHARNYLFGLGGQFDSSVVQYPQDILEGGEVEKESQKSNTLEVPNPIYGATVEPIIEGIEPEEEDHAAKVLTVLSTIPLQEIAHGLVKRWRENRKYAESQRGQKDSTNHGTGQATSSSRSERRVPKSKKGPGESNRRTKRPRTDSHEESDEDDDKTAKHPRNDPPDDNFDSGSSGKARQLRCPFNAFDPQRFSQRNRHEPQYRHCSRCKLSTIPRLKQHLERRHQRPSFYCRICFEVFTSGADCNVHAGARTCVEKSENECPFAEKMTDDQVRDIRLRQRGVSEYAKWYYIFKLLFPGAVLPSSPYVVEEDDDDLRDFLGYLQQQLPEAVATRLATLGFTDVEIHRITEAFVLEEAIDEVAADYSPDTPVRPVNEAPSARTSSRQARLIADELPIAESTSPYVPHNNWPTPSMMEAPPLPDLVPAGVFLAPALQDQASEAPESDAEVRALQREGQLQDVFDGEFDFWEFLWRPGERPPATCKSAETKADDLGSHGRSVLSV